MHSEGWAVSSELPGPAQPWLVPNWRQLSPNWEVEHCPVQSSAALNPGFPQLCESFWCLFSPFKHIFANRTVWELFLELFLAQQIKGAVLPFVFCRSSSLPFQLLFCSLQSSTSTADVSLLRGGSSRALLYFLQPVLNKKKLIFIVIMSNQSALNKLQLKEWIFRFFFFPVAKKHLHHYWKDWNPWFLFGGFNFRSETCFLNLGRAQASFVSLFV